MRRTFFMAGVLALGLGAGCGGGPKLTVVKGKLTRGGETVLPDRIKSGMTIVFVPAEPSKDAASFPGNFKNADDTFEVPGPDGKGIPAGKYKVTLNILTLTPSPAVDAINRKYGGNSPIVVEVTGSEPINIDLAKYEK
jgi:hypothetical protein